MERDHQTGISVQTTPTPMKFLDNSYNNHHNNNQESSSSSSNMRILNSLDDYHQEIAVPRRPVLNEMDFFGNIKKETPASSAAASSCTTAFDHRAHQLLVNVCSCFSFLFFFLISSYFIEVFIIRGDYLFIHKYL